MKTRQRVGALLVAALLGLGGAVALSTPAAASDWGPYKLVHTISGLCMEVPHGSMQPGEQLRLGVCGPNPTWYQLFWFSDASGGPWRYFIRPGHNLWCTTPGSPKLYRSTIIQWGCDWSNNNEIWFEQTSLDPVGSYLFQNNQSGFYLTVDWDDMQVGGYVRQGLPTATGTPHFDYWTMVHL